MAEYKDLAERTIATFLQAAIGAMGTNSVMAVSYTHLTLPTTPYV